MAARRTSSNRAQRSGQQTKRQPTAATATVRGGTRTGSATVAIGNAGANTARNFVPIGSGGKRRRSGHQRRASNQQSLYDTHRINSINSEVILSLAASCHNPLWLTSLINAKRWLITAGMEAIGEFTQVPPLAGNSILPAAAHRVNVTPMTYSETPAPPPAPHPAPHPAPPHSGTTIFEYMSRRCQDLGAINLGQGFPDLPEPAELIKSARAALSGHSNQYPPMRGLPELRRAIAGYYAQTQGLSVSDDEIIVTSGGTEALASTILALVAPGDEVILVQPLYDAYLPLVERAGGIARYISLTPPDWRLPLAALAAAITPRTRLIIVNTPNNPTGTLIDAGTLTAIGDLCEAHDLLLICDEVWEGMVLGTARHVSPLTIPRLRHRAVKIGSAGKIFSLTGWKVGWTVASPALSARIAARHQFLTFTTATPLQWAVAEGLALPPAWHDAHRARYAAGRERLTRGLQAAGYALLPADATWFVTIDLAASGLPADDRAISEGMLAAGVGSIPVSAFYAAAPETGYLRLCFAKQDATLDAAITRLAAFRAGIEGGAAT